MNAFEKIKDFDSQPLSQISYNMIKWFDFDRVDIDMRERGNVESGVWINITIAKEENIWYVDGQRIDIVKRRLIEFLQKQTSLNK